MLSISVIFVARGYESLKRKGEKLIEIPLLLLFVAVTIVLIVVTHLMAIALMNVLHGVVHGCWLGHKWKDHETCHGAVSRCNRCGKEM